MERLKRRKFLKSKSPPLPTQSTQAKSSILSRFSADILRSYISIPPQSSTDMVQMREPPPGCSLQARAPLSIQPHQRSPHGFQRLLNWTLSTHTISDQWTLVGDADGDMDGLSNASDFVNPAAYTSFFVLLTCRHCVDLRSSPRVGPRYSECQPTGTFRFGCCWSQNLIIDGHQR